jgi:hypothetical protein
VALAPRTKRHRLNRVRSVCRSALPQVLLTTTISREPYAVKWLQRATARKTNDHQRIIGRTFSANGRYRNLIANEREED